MEVLKSFGETASDYTSPTYRIKLFILGFSSPKPARFVRRLAERAAESSSDKQRPLVALAI